ncbi:hypothetical protein VTL71DRAFT_14654 [Oculimacula yallundae]|uniref:Uncharacterized protein n=1 Tax=Oculimacula yallundae TaxID=86028 RepID=A0ABR4CJM9_9HELO
MPSLMPDKLRRSFNTTFPNDELSNQWVNPSDIFTALLILGGDGGEMVAKAVAQLSGRGLVPVAFSIGWVVFAVKSALSALAGNNLLPAADSKCIVINGKTGYIRDNSSWVIGRISRDFERWMDPAVKGKIDSMLDEKLRFDQMRSRDDAETKSRMVRPNQAGLCVAVYRAEAPLVGFTGGDHLYYTGFIVTLLQLGISVIPFGIFGDWSILLIVAAGTILSFATCSVPQWGREKWACRAGTNKSIVITQGNGSQFAILILGDHKGLDLEDLSIAKGNLQTHISKLQMIVLAALWIILLITATGIKEHSWFLFAVCAIGIFQNIYVSTTWRSPEAYGLPLIFERVIGEMKVMETLFAVEEAYPGIGESMLNVFIPGRLTPAEEAKWAELSRTVRARSRGP